MSYEKLSKEAFDDLTPGMQAIVCFVEAILANPPVPRPQQLYEKPVANMYKMERKVIVTY